MPFSYSHPPQSASAMVAALEKAAPLCFILNVQKWDFLLPVVQTALWAQNSSLPYVFPTLLTVALSFPLILREC